MTGDWMHFYLFSQLWSRVSTEQNSFHQLWRKACEEGTEQDRIAAMDSMYRQQNQNKTPSDSQG